MGFVRTLSDMADDAATAPAVLVPLATATARRVTASGVNLDDGRDGVGLDFLLAGCTVISC